MEKSKKYYKCENLEFKYQASKFGAALLMPKNQYFQILNKYTKDTIVDINSVANYFNVSVDKAINRGKDLNYLI